MRKEKQDAARQTMPERATVQGYHAGGHYAESAEAYAYLGFRRLAYYTSDRTIPLTMEGDEIRRPDGKPLKGYGLEIETESQYVTDAGALAEIYDKIIFPHFPADLFKMQRDGSLGGRSSAECITQVMTKEAIRNAYPAFRLMYNHYFKAFGLSCDSGNCGMHVNISLGCFGTSAAAQLEAVRKLYYFINRYYDLSCELFRRNRARTHYCSAMPYADAKTLNPSNFYTNHGVSFNLGHYDAGRIEIRLVGGQKDFGAFRNTMETVFHLVDAVKRISWKALEDGDLVQVFKGCNQHVYNRISTMCAQYFSQAQLEEIAASVQTEDIA